MSQITRIYHSKQFHVEMEVNSQYNNLRVDQFVKVYYPSLSRNFIQKKIKKGDIYIKNRPRQFKTLPHTLVKFRDQICMEVENSVGEQEEAFGSVRIPWPKKIPILWDGEEFCVVHKPPFMVTHPTGRQLFHAVTNYLSEQLGQFVYSVHRLDKETSGLLILAKTAEVSQRFTDYFSEHQIQKCYFLLSRKNRDLFEKKVFPLEAKEPLTLAMARHYPQGVIPAPIEEKVGVQTEDTQDALTYFYLLEENETHVLSLAVPKTGRQHQIRLHAAYHGFPIVGDKLYLKDPSFFQRYKEKCLSEDDVQELEHYRQALHAIYLRIPKVKELLFAPLGEDLEALIGRIFPHLDLSPGGSFYGKIKERILSLSDFDGKRDY